MIDWRLSCNSYDGKSFLQVIKKTEKTTSDFIKDLVPKDNSLIIAKRNGEIDCVIKDGKYHLDGEITIEKGHIKHIDNGTWTPFHGKVTK